MVEKIAFFYPRVLRMTVGSREIRESEEDFILALKMTGLLAIPCIPATLVCGAPALTIRTGRNVKRKFSKLKKSKSRKSKDNLLDDNLRKDDSSSL